MADMGGKTAGRPQPGAQLREGDQRPGRQPPGGAGESAGRSARGMGAHPGGTAKVCNLDNLQIAVRQAGFGLIEATASFGDAKSAAIERMGLGFNKALVTLMLIEQTPDGGLILLDDMDTHLDTAAARRLTQQLQKARERVQIIGTTSRQDTYEWTRELKAWTRRRTD